ncbi:GGDEF domain-containing protein [Bradyrhizobium sp. SSBR45G]|uniref:GGDEF domain-containing protein n=1 Tax=unclassified Bradyrhizobium TaxID=2631580 RepID=UPI0023429F71|nr:MULTISPECIES: GGDEF domain-containing protein [unclassified Bradyrhizobium]GLH78945.1 GGDEF domain-containing protein [Bradyrhizobium sp. SSBR45G]GLH85268.1 GGDEF domain-containing protein [Bradyrhizobium sp. SSBR45R]
MRGDGLAFSLPRWRVTRWLADPGYPVSSDIRVSLIGELYGCWSVFAGGAINTVAVAAALALRAPTVLFISWFVLEVAICLSRLIVMIISYRRARAKMRTPTDIHILLSVAWSASVGFGVGISLGSGDWVAASLTCISSAAMVGGICFRNFSAPRLVGTMILFSVGPVIPGVAMSHEPLLFAMYLQMPVYFLAMTGAAFRLNKMLVAVMHAKRESDERARLDPLTGLNNRAGLIDALQSRLTRKAIADQSFALLYLDLDGFKPVNDTFGHAAGDELLKIVAATLRQIVSPADVIARIGGDEFVVLASDPAIDHALALGERIIDVMTAPLTLPGGTRVNIGMSIGIAAAPDHGNDPESLLFAADAALYEAKSSGKSCWRLASAEANLAALRKFAGGDLTATSVASAA